MIIFGLLAFIGMVIVSTQNANDINDDDDFPLA